MIKRLLMLATAALVLTAAPAIASAPVGTAPGSGTEPGHSIQAKRRCTPGYSPCIRNKLSDVDCYGGSGNGPRYTKPGVTYRVWGRDRYRLDADNDGWGCE